MADLLTFDNVTAGYANAVVLDRMSFSLGAGQSLAVLGRNGVGKTTLLETLMGNTRVMSGAIRWLGQDITPRAVPQASARRPGVGTARARGVPLADRGGEPDRRGAARRMDPRSRL